MKQEMDILCYAMEDVMSCEQDKDGYKTDDMVRKNKRIMEAICIISRRGTSTDSRRAPSTSTTSATTMTTSSTTSSSSPVILAGLMFVYR